MGYEEKVESNGIGIQNIKNMMKKMKLESMKEMLGAMAPDGFLESLNMKLNEIKKENLNG